ncbi:RNA polymerase subunit sigma-24, partial [Streptomyces bottropensis]
MYPHVGVDASGLATLRATVNQLLRGFVPTAYAVPALATSAAPGGGAGPRERAAPGRGGAERGGWGPPPPPAAQPLGDR